MTHFTLFVVVFLCPLLISCGSPVPSVDWVVNDRYADQYLSPCPATPNCLCSEDRNSLAWIAPLDFEGEPDSAWAKAVGLVADMGGEVLHHNDEYFHVVFTSLIFRFKDDFELRLCRENKLIHIRSASRVGHSDFGVNRRRIERLRERFMADPLQ